MKKVITIGMILIMVLTATFAMAETVSQEYIEEYMYNISGEMNCKSLGIVDISTMTQKDFNAWCFGLFPDMTQEEAIDSVYVGLIDEQFADEYDVWGLYTRPDNSYELKFIVAFKK